MLQSIFNILFLCKFILCPECMYYALKLILEGSPLFIGKYIIVPLLVLQDAHSLLNIIAASSIPMASGYLTDRFALNNRVHVCHNRNCTHIPFQLLISIQVTLFHILLET